MNHKRPSSYLALGLILPSLSLAESQTTIDENLTVAQRLYAGIDLGYATTDWSMLNINDPSSILSESLPIGANDKGFSYGFSLGYSLNQYFSLETAYSHFSNAYITLQFYNTYTHHPGPDAQTLTSKTSAFDMSAKFTIPIPVITNMQAFSSAGVAVVHRNDNQLTIFNNNDPTNQTFGVNTYRVGGVFGAGLIYNFSKYFFCQTSFKYYTGYGRSNDRPVEFYIPFIYKGSIMFAFRF